MRRLLIVVGYGARRRDPGRDHDLVAPGGRTTTTPPTPPAWVREAEGGESRSPAPKPANTTEELDLEIDDDTAPSGGLGRRA
jgi:hypothetical protein